jgi:hypothetical protein
LSVVSGVGTVPPDEELESITLQAYRELNKSSAQPISKSEFTKWISSFLGEEAEPTIQKVSEKFGLTIPKSVEVSPEEQHEEHIQPISVSKEVEATDTNETIKTENATVLVKANQQVEAYEPIPTSEEVPVPSSAPVENSLLAQVEAPTPSNEFNLKDARDKNALEIEIAQSETEGVQEAHTQFQDLSVTNELTPAEPAAEFGSMTEENVVAETVIKLPETQNFDALDLESLEYAAEAGLAPPSGDEPTATIEDVAPTEEKVTTPTLEQTVPAEEQVVLEISAEQGQ